MAPGPAAGGPGRLGLAGAVLCGGHSRRMGTDKALLEVGGRAMARRVADALQAAGVETVVAIGGQTGALERLGFAVVPDRWPGEGPLGGVITALAWARTGPAPELVAVLACDLVAPDPRAVLAVVDAARASGADVAVPVIEGRPQWVHAVWRTRIGTMLADVFAAGERSLVGATAGLRIERVGGLEAAFLADADEPVDLPPEPV